MKSKKRIYCNYKKKKKISKSPRRSRKYRGGARASKLNKSIRRSLKRSRKTNRTIAASGPSVYRNNTLPYELKQQTHMGKIKNTRQLTSQKRASNLFTRRSTSPKLYQLI